LFFFFWGLGLAQAVWFELDPASPTLSLAQATDMAGQQERVN